MPGAAFRGAARADHVETVVVITHKNGEMVPGEHSKGATNCFVIQRENAVSQKVAASVAPH